MAHQPFKGAHFLSHGMLAAIVPVVVIGGGGAQASAPSGPVSAISRVHHIENGARIIGASEQLDVWDVANRTLLRRMEDSHGGIDSFAIVPGAELVLTTSRGHVSSWDVSRGTRVDDYGKIDEHIKDVAVSPDGKQALLVGGAGAQLLDLQTKRIVKKVVHKAMWNARGHFSKSGPYAVWESKPGIVVWDISKNRQRFLFPLPDQNLSKRAIPTHDGSHLVVSSYAKKELYLVDADKGKQEARFDSTWETITDAELSHDGSRLATCAGQVAMLWDVQAQQPVWKFKPNSRKALIWSSITFAPDGRSVLLGNHPQEHRPTLRRYSVETGDLVEQFTSQQWSPPVSLSLNRDGSSLAIAYGGFDRTVMLWDVERIEPLRWVLSTDKAAGMIKEVKLSPDGQRLAVAINDRLELRNLAKNSVHSVPLGRSGSISISGSTFRTKTTVVGFGVGHTALSADGTLAAATGHGGRMAVWDVDRGQELRSESEELGDLQLAYGSGILFEPDARGVVWSVRGKGGLRTLSTSLGQGAPSEQWKVFFAPQDITLDGKRVVGRDDKSRQSSIDFANRRSVCSLPQAIEKTALAPAAGRWFAIKQASVVAEYNLDTCQELRQFELPKAKLRTITASGDGHFLAMLDGPSTVRLLDTRTGQTIAIMVDGRAWSAYRDDQLLRSSNP